MENRNKLILAIGMLLLGLAIGIVGGGMMGFFMGRRSARVAYSMMRGYTMPIYPGQLPGQTQPIVPPSRFQRPQNIATAARVTQIEKESPAEKAGLKVNDVITAIGGTKLDATHSLADLIGAKKPGDQVELAITRGAQSLTITAELGASPKDASKAYIGVHYDHALSRNLLRRRDAQ